MLLGRAKFLNEFQKRFSLSVNRLNNSLCSSSSPICILFTILDKIGMNTSCWKSAAFDWRTSFVNNIPKHILRILKTWNLAMEFSDNVVLYDLLPATISGFAIIMPRKESSKNDPCGNMPEK